jgi:hypothetical protein
MPELPDGPPRLLPLTRREYHRACEARARIVAELQAVDTDEIDPEQADALMALMWALLVASTAYEHSSALYRLRQRVRARLSPRSGAVHLDDALARYSLTQQIETTLPGRLLGPR